MCGGTLPPSHDLTTIKARTRAVYPKLCICMCVRVCVHVHKHIRMHEKHFLFGFSLSRFPFSNLVAPSRSNAHAHVCRLVDCRAQNATVSVFKLLVLDNQFFGLGVWVWVRKRERMPFLEDLLLWIHKKREKENWYTPEEDRGCGCVRKRLLWPNDFNLVDLETRWQPTAKNNITQIVEDGVRCFNVFKKMCVCGLWWSNR